MDGFSLNVRQRRKLQQEFLTTDEASQCIQIQAILAVGTG